MHHGLLFPLLQWYVYPALGICFGTILQHVSDLKALYRRVGTCAAVLLICLILSVSHPVSLLIKDTAAGRFVKQTSSHLTGIFVIHWILIGLVFVVLRMFDIPHIPLPFIVPVGVLLTLATGFILQLFLKKKCVNNLE